MTKEVIVIGVYPDIRGAFTIIHCLLARKRIMVLV